MVIGMNLFEGKQVTLTMSHEEWAQFQRGYEAAWYFIRDVVEKSTPTGRTFGRGLALEIELEDLRDRVRRLESQTEFETSEDDARIKKLEQDVSALINGHNKGIERISKLEDERRAHKSEFFANLYGMSPTGREHEFRVVPETHASSFEKGADHGLETAVLRVRRYMTGHFSEATIGGVVQAIREGEDKAPVLDPERDVITDHAFRFQSGGIFDKTRCSYRKNHRGQPCGMLKSDHSYAQAQP